MAANNLRILYNNVADTATITATTSAVGYSTANLKSDIKGVVWRSTTKSATTITLTWTTDQRINAVILPYTNLSTSATIRVVVKNSAAASLYDSGTVAAVPYSLKTNVSGVYSYSGNTSTRIYTTSTLTTARSVEITISDAGNTKSYMEVSRVVCGETWSPVHNTEFGLSVSYTDTSKHSRSYAGNIITDVGPVYKTLSFSLGYMLAADRNELVNILQLNSLRKSIWVSLFPNDSEPEKEYIYSIYGRLSQSATITHPMYTKYVSEVTVEEV